MSPQRDDIGPHRVDGEAPYEATVRPQGFADFIGQDAVKANLGIMVQAAKLRGTACDHILFAGPPGLGKTTLALIIAREMGAQLHTTSGPVLEKKGDLAGLLSGMSAGDVLFIDEIHRLNPIVEENLYPAMEDFEFDIIIGEGPHARSLKLQLPRFTLVGATTRAGLLTSPLQDRFGYVARMRYYDVENLTRDGAHEIARRSRGTPRIANRLLRRVCDFALVKNIQTVDATLADDALELFEIDRAGFDYMDRKYLSTIIEKFSGGPVGVNTISAAIGEERDTIEDVVEPYLLQEGFIDRTPRGRIATERAYRHLGLAIAGRPVEQSNLFDS